MILKPAKLPVSLRDFLKNILMVHTESRPKLNMINLKHKKMRGKRTEKMKTISENVRL